MGAYIKQNGDYSYNAESSYDYEADGYIIDVRVLDKPSKVYCGTNLIVLLANTTVRLTIQQVSGGLVSYQDVTLLTLLGNSANLNLTNTNTGINYWSDVAFSFNALIDDDTNNTGIYNLPLVVATGSAFVTFSFDQWTYRNTYSNVTSVISFSVQSRLYPQLVVLNGELTSADVIQSINTFNITGSSVIGNTKGSFREYIDSISLGTNLGNLAAWDLCKCGYTFAPSRITPSKTFTGFQTTIAFESARTFFQHTDGYGQETTKVTISFDYFDKVSETQKSFSFESNIRLFGLQGVVLLSSTSSNEYVASYFPSNLIYQRLNVSDNNVYFYRTDYIDENLYSRIDLTIKNLDTDTEYGTNVRLPSGHYQVAIDLVVNPQYTIHGVTPFLFNLYEYEPTDLTVESMIGYYRIQTKFDPSKLIVNARHLIYGNDYHLERIYYPEFTTNYDNYVFTLDDIPSVNVVVSYYIWSLETTLTKTIQINVVAPTGDNLYVFNKKTLQKTNYGEIQQGFNFNFVLDQTKDNAKVEVLNRYKDDIKPFTIVYLESTDTWWIVKNDTVTRYESEDVPLYKHEISLMGAIEILNARDLTNCGFNVDRYTIQSFFERLITFIDFEVTIEIDFGTYLDPNKVVDYLKTFENYSPLSAIKEMCNGMNVKPVLTFVCPSTTITSAILSFVPNSGLNEPVIDIDEFDDSQEKITSDKESYGSKVVSNIQNCTSGRPIRYPANGTCIISSSEHKVTYDTAEIRLPTKAKEVTALYFCGNYAIGFTQNNLPLIFAAVSHSDVYNEFELNENIETALDRLESGDFPQPVIDYFSNLIRNNLQYVKATIQDLGVTKMFNGGNYDNETGLWNGKQVKFKFRGYPTEAIEVAPGFGPIGDRSNSICLNEKRYYDTFSQQKAIIYWEQGSDLIKNFRFYDNFTIGDNDTTWEDGKDRLQIIYEYDYNGEKYQFGIFTGGEQVTIDPHIPPAENNVGFSMLGNRQAHYVVYYIPQDDIKVKVENGLLNNDTNLYNQNGTLVSSKAVSKLINSHARAISSEEITRYKRYYSFFSVPKVGQIVNNNGVKYVINNVSIDFAENDNNLYALDCMFTMTKQIACKSTMINANSVIRDYPTPQNNNIRRIQCYRDYVLLSYGDVYSHIDDTYLPITQILGFLEKQLELGSYIGYVDTHTALMQIQFYEGSIQTYYYQLPVIRYDLDKMFVEIIDFKDNNIIGYAGQSAQHVFSIETWYKSLNGDQDQVNIPISYVNSVGELSYINMILVDNEQITNIYEQSREQFIHDNPDYEGVQSLYNSSCIIPQEIFDLAFYNHLYDIQLLESRYRKDGLEIPVFEYSCQVDGNGGIEIAVEFLKGEILDAKSLYVYHYKVVENAYLTEENALLYIGDTEEKQYMDNGNMYINNQVEFSIDNESDIKKLVLTFNSQCIYGVLSDKSKTYTQASLSALGKTILIYRNKITIDENEPDSFVSVGNDEFVMALNYCNQSGGNGTINVRYHRYKLK